MPGVSNLAILLISTHSFHFCHPFCATTDFMIDKRSCDRIMQRAYLLGMCLARCHWATPTPLLPNLSHILARPECNGDSLLNLKTTSLKTITTFFLPQIFLFINLHLP